MSVARGFGLNGKSVYANVTKLMEVDLQFTVTPTNGLGITSLKSNGYVRNVFMHTSTTPGENDGATNPNPANGYAVIQLNNSFNKFLGLAATLQAPNSGSAVKIDNSALTPGQAYTITVLGNATAAKWLAIGVPAGVTPAVGVSFIALTDGGAGNTLTSRVQAPSTSGIRSVEVVGDPNQSLQNTSLAANGGAYLLIQFMGETLTAGAYTPTGTINSQAFTGDALAAHSHTIPVTAGTAGDAVTNNAGVLESTGGQDLTTSSDTAGTPAGTIEQAVFTGDAASLTATAALTATAPTAGTVVSLRLKFDGSSVTIDGL